MRKFNFNFTKAYFSEKGKEMEFLPTIYRR